MGIEGVRGVAALFVALSHVLYQNLLAPEMRISPFLRELEAGHAGVLIFFALSGYVISWTNSSAFSGTAARSYLRRRFIRLFPIYFLAMVLTVLVIMYTGMYEPARVVVGSFLCLQNFNGYFGPGLNPPRVNNPLWSLNYEVLYYGLFLLLWRYRPRLGWVFVPALFAGIICWFAPRYMPLFIASYGCGWVIWASGWWLSKLPLDKEARVSAPVASWLLLVFANHHINGVARVLNALHFYSNDAGMVNFADLGSLPAILLALSAVTHRKLPYRTWFVFSAWAVCLIPIAGMIFTGRLGANESWKAGIGAVVLAGLVMPLRTDRWLRPFAWFGGISYAFYVVHYPLAYIVQNSALPVTGVGGFFLRLILWIVLTVVVSWLLEKRFQPWIKGVSSSRARPST